MNKYLVGALGGLIGALVLVSTYRKGFNKGVKATAIMFDLGTEVKDGES